MYFVCEKCVEEDLGLQQFIANKGQPSQKCYYCDKQSDSKKIELEILTNHILICFKESDEINVYNKLKQKSKKIEYEAIISSFVEDRVPVKKNIISRH